MTSSTPADAAWADIDATLVADAAALGIDIVAACEAGLVQAIRQRRDADRFAANREAIAEWNGWADTADVPRVDPGG